MSESGDSFKTSLLAGLLLLYASHGGPKSIVRSSYVHAAILLAGLCWRFALTEEWVEFAQSSLPILAGFSIAAYAILFVVLDEKARKALAARSEKLEGRSPLLVLASTISHALVVQICAFIYSLVFASKPFSSFLFNNGATYWINVALSAVGLTLMFYGLVIVLSSVLTLFRLLEIQSRVQLKS